MQSLNYINAALRDCKSILSLNTPFGKGHHRILPNVTLLHPIIDNTQKNNRTGI